MNPWQIESRFPCHGKQLIICKVTLGGDDLNPPLPAYHSDLSICWAVIGGEGFVLFDQMKEDWLFAPVIPGSKFDPDRGECFAFFPCPSDVLEFELGCQESQLNGGDLDYMGVPPKSAKIYLTGIVTKIGKDGVVLTEGGVSALVEATEEEKGCLTIGERDSLPMAVEINHFLEIVRSSGRTALMSPIAGDKHQSNRIPDIGNEPLPESPEEEPPRTTRLARVDHSLKYVCPRAGRYFRERDKPKRP